MNRQETIQALVWLKQIEARAKAEAAELQQRLAEDARAEFAKEGAAPTWRFRDLARVSASVSNEAVVVENAAAFLLWVKARYPTEIETVEQIRAAFQTRILADAKVEGERVCDAEGEVIPGLGVRKGGEFIGVSVTVDPTAKTVFGAVASEALKRMAVEAGPAVPVVLAELSDAAQS